MPDLPSEPRPNPRSALLVLALACVGTASMTYYHLGLFIPKLLEARASIGLGKGYSYGDDFYPIWLTARESRIGHRDLYSYQMTREIQSGLTAAPNTATAGRATVLNVPAARISEPSDSS